MGFMTLWTPPSPKEQKTYATYDEYAQDKIFNKVIKRSIEPKVRGEAL